LERRPRTEKSRAESVSEGETGKEERGREGGGKYGGGNESKVGQPLTHFDSTQPSRQTLLQSNLLLTEVSSAVVSRNDKREECARDSQSVERS
jgi:hypothetical protein